MTDEGDRDRALPTVLLESKFHAPLLRPMRVSRPRLLARLDVPRPLTLIEAPVGFGKSTLLAEWCAGGAGGRRWAWLSFDDGDNDPIIYWSYILHALRRLKPEGFAAGLRLLGQPGVSLTRSVLPALLNELWSLDEPLALVLDDYHQVSNPACHESLNFFLRRLPPALRLVIATRTTPDLGLGALRARGDLTELRADALRFSDDEAVTLLTERLGLPLTAEDAERLAERTEGWAAGLYLGALSLREQDDPRAFIADFAGSHRHIVDYLGGEVLDRLSDAEYAFLLQTSVLDGFTAPLCDAVTGSTDAAARLAALEQTNQFVISLDARRTQYRYHHLFRELLQVELKRTQPEMLSDIHRRAASWYRAAGNMDAAMRHALAGEDFDLAGGLFVQFAQRLVATGYLTTVMNWIGQFPEAVVAASPQLAITVALAAGVASRPTEEIRHWISYIGDGADTELGPLEFSSIQSAAGWIRASLFDDVGTALQNAREVAQREGDSGRLSYGFARLSLGQSLYFAGRTQEARLPLEEAIHAPLAERQQGTVLRALALLALVDLDAKDTARAEDLVRQSLQLAEATGQADYPGMWLNHLALGMVLFRRGLVEEAQSTLERGVEGHLPGLSTWYFEYAFALLALASVRSACGYTQAARSLLDEARSVIARCVDPGMLPALLDETERAIGRPVRRAVGLRQELSEGELRVMRLLVSDLSQREIGRELYLSLNTIRTHTRNIYTKLDVASRPEAVTRARALGLLA